MTGVSLRAVLAISVTCLLACSDGESAERASLGRDHDPTGAGDPSSPAPSDGSREGPRDADDVNDAGGSKGDSSAPSSPSTPWSPAGCTAMAGATGFTNRSVGTFKYVAYVPASYSTATAHRLVVALHGAGDTAKKYVDIVWKANADAKGLVVLAPEGSLPLGGGTTWEAADATKTLGAIDDLEKCYRVDPKRRIVNGFSAGGRLAFYLALKNATRFAGIAVAGSAFLSNDALYLGVSPLPAAWKVPVSHFHGDQDGNFPISFAQQGKTQLMTAGHPYELHVLAGVGHTTSAAQASNMVAELMSSSAP